MEEAASTCPYKYYESTFKEPSSSCDRDFCLEAGARDLQQGKQEGKQVWTQMFVADVEYCVFVLWTLTDCAVLTHCSRVLF